MMAPTTDEDAALAAISTLAELSTQQKDAQEKINAILHLDGDSPFVDIHELFGLYNILYFRSLLLPRVEVLWSTRLTLCAGMCELVKDDEGKYRRIRLKMSEPLLKYRPRSDTINTLLHEAIHAYFFITTKWQHSRGDDGTGHGAGFLLLADAISNQGEYEITVYHTFHDEVDSYRTHIWKCDGPCQLQPPYFGLVKRSINRAPSTSDQWWSKHENDCGGTYTKIAEPDPTKTQLLAMSARERAGRQKNKLDAWVQKSSIKNGIELEKPASQMLPSAERGRTIGAPTSEAVEAGNVFLGKRKRESENDRVESLPKQMLVTCPICDQKIKEAEINEHLDSAHSST